MPSKLHYPALVLRWREPDDPLPVRIIQTAGPPRAPLWHELHSSAGSMPAGDGPFDFTRGVQRLLMDIAIRSPDFRHLQVPRILVTVTQARGKRDHGMQARVTPLRFAGGALTQTRRGIRFQIQRFFLNDHEFLYVMTFCLPRFLNQDFDRKFVTLFHELHHIGPEFDGDMRRHGGRYHVHTHSQRDYDERMAQMAREYLATRPDPSMYDFFRLNFAQLQARHGGVSGIVVPRPKIIPILTPARP
ncbi:MAG: hypothetical protein HYX68_18285 [Planctomycetes bacterium]|jgi:hypothetical protein|nr:hypothetical protein [Planctomycetota bacterium]